VLRVKKKKKKKTLPKSAPMAAGKNGPRSGFLLVSDHQHENVDNNSALDGWGEEWEGP